MLVGVAVLVMDNEMAATSLTNISEEARMARAIWYHLTQYEVVQRLCEQVFGVVPDGRQTTVTQYFVTVEPAAEYGLASVELSPPPFFTGSDKTTLFIRPATVEEQAGSKP